MDPINILSCNNLDARHVLMWDYDVKFSLTKDVEKLKQLKQLAEEEKLDIIILQTGDGIHLVDFYLRTFEETNRLQARLSSLFPSDYPTISQVKEEDEEQGQRFLGCTLIISPKDNDEAPKYLYRTCAKDITGNSQYSVGHVETYNLMLNTDVTPFRGSP